MEENFTYVKFSGILEENMDLDALRHSASHIMADAVKRLFPETRLGIGPAIENGFYYDFDREAPFTPEDLAKIEHEMQKIVKEDTKFIREEISKKEAKKIFEKMKEPYKLELLENIKDDKVSVYKHAGFLDLCKGPHIKSTGEVKVFKLLSIAGAYWHGIETNPMLQRIYGTAFETKKDLDQYLKLLEEAKKRDHRMLAKSLDLLSFNADMGAGLVLFHPKGAMLRTVVEDYIKWEHVKRGYELVISPHILKSDIWIRSGHYEYYKDNMYIFKIEGQEYAVKPMNCPGHMLVYKSKKRSYRELPLRYFELGSVYRHEKSGVLHGLLRVRGFTQDDAHLFCKKEDVETEIIGVLDFVKDALEIFGFDEFSVEVSTKPEKYIGTDKDWEEATKSLCNALDKKGLKYEINEGEGAFYGPKIDIKLKDALDRRWQCATIQCDFALPERFDLTYVGKDGREKRPVMLHRVILGSIERFLGALIEHYGGAFPLWLSPVQVAVIPIAESQEDYAVKLREKLEAKQIRVSLDLRSEKMQKKIRDAEVEKIPYMAIVGEKEKKENKISVRARQKGDIGSLTQEEFIEKLLTEIKDKGR